MARFFSRLLRMRWAVALCIARRVARELQRLSRSERGEVVRLTKKAAGRLA